MSQDRTIVNVSTEQLLAKIGALQIENDGLRTKLAQVQQANADLSQALNQSRAAPAAPRAPAAE